MDYADRITDGLRTEGIRYGNLCSYIGCKDDSSQGIDISRIHFKQMKCFKEKDDEGSCSINYGKTGSCVYVDSRTADSVCNDVFVCFWLASVF